MLLVSFSLMLLLAGSNKAVLEHHFSTPHILGFFFSFSVSFVLHLNHFCKPFFHFSNFFFALANSLMSVKAFLLNLVVFFPPEFTISS